MTAYPLNLIRGRPVPLLQRAHVAWALALYFLVAGSLLAWECNRAVHQVLNVHRRGLDIAARHTAFLQAHPGVVDVETYTAGRRRQLGEQGAALAAISRVLARQRPVSELITGLLAPLSADVRLQNLDLNLAAGTVRFDLAVPLDVVSGKADSATLLAAWQRHPALQRWVTGLHEVSNEEGSVAGVAVFVIRFEGTVSCLEG